MRSFYFGTGRRLYGTLHEAKGAGKSTGVLLCYPGVQEYNMTHWAFRKLAGLITRDGLPVLRFDYSCSGDSDGDVHDARLEHQVEDIATAADELKDQTGVRRVAVIGMRLGALLATQAVANGLDASALLLWEPIFHGARYVAELERLDSDICTRRQHRIVEPRTELGGYPFPAALRQALNGLELQRFVPARAGRVAMFLTADGPDASATKAAWERAGLKVSSQVVREESGGVTQGAGEGDSAVLYTQMLTAMAEHLNGAKAVAAA